MKNKIMKATGLLAGLAASAAVSAHTGDHSSGLAAGILHPLTGLDHLLVLMVLGLWACRDSGGLRPAGAFLGAMLAGGMLAFAGVGLPAIETMIAASVVLGGLLLARQARPGLLAAASFGVLGLFHGQAHMAGLPGQAEPLLFALGLTAVSVAVIAAFRQAGVQSRVSLRKAAGYATAAAGVALLLGA